ncbi:MAG: signal peptidase I [Mangrovibacterium sp.]
MRWFLMILVIGGGFFLAKGIYWLALPLAGLAVLMVVLARMNFIRKHKWLFRFIVISLFLGILTAVYGLIFKIVWIPSGSMEDTLIPGDKVLISRYSAGFPGIRRNEIVVFKHQLEGEDRRFFIKRCIGLPGDTLVIREGQVRINGKALAEPALSKRLYRVWCDNPDQIDHLAGSRGIAVWRRYFKGRKIESVSMILTAGQRSAIEKAAGIDSARADISGNEPEDWVEPKDKQFKWTPDNYGPLVIPRKGLQIVLNRRNFLLYRRTIEELESGKPEEIKGHYYLDGKQTDTYTFGRNYYFMMGDNRSLSNDSRNWGFVPEEEIIGNASLIIFSRGSTGFRWNRFLKVIQ